VQPFGSLCSISSGIYVEPVVYDVPVIIIE